MSENTMRLLSLPLQAAVKPPKRGKRIHYGYMPIRETPLPPEARYATACGDIQYVRYLSRDHALVTCLRCRKAMAWREL